MTTKEIVITVGIPGSGKDFKVEQYLKYRHLIKISRDEVRKILSGEDENYFDEEPLVTRICYRTLEHALLSKNVSTIVIANTSTTVRSRNQIYNDVKEIIAKSNVYIDVQYTIYYFLPKIDVCMKLQEYRDRRVPRHVLERMAQQIVDPRTTFEYDLAQIFVFDPEDALTEAQNGEKDDDDGSFISPGGVVITPGDG